MTGDFHLPQFEMPYIPSHSESYQNIVIEHICKLEKEVPAEHELQVFASVAGEYVRARRLQFTDGAIVIVHGFDNAGNPTFVMSPSFALELVCKIIKIEPEAKRMKIGFDMFRKSLDEY